MTIVHSFGRQRTWRLLLASSLATLVACGGGNGPDTPPTAGPAPAPERPAPVPAPAPGPAPLPAPVVPAPEPPQAPEPNPVPRPGPGGGPLATVTSPLRDVAVEERLAATFSIGVSTSLPFTVQWSRDGVVLAGRSGTELTLAPSTVDDDGAQFRAVLMVGGVNSPSGSLATQIDAGTARLSVNIATPAAPTELRADLIGDDTTARLGWADNSNDETAFDVIWATEGQDVVLSTLPADSTRFNVTGVPRGSTQTFRVRAVRAVGGRSAMSSAASVTVTMPSTVPDVPAAPTNARLTLASDVAGAVDFEWDDNADNETGFELHRVVDGNDMGLAPVAANQTQFRITGLAPESTHTFRVRAVRSVNGTITRSALVSATITMPPAQAETVTLTPTHDNVVRISTIDASVANQVLNQVPVEVGCTYIIDFGAAGSAATCSRSLLKFDTSAVAGRTIRRAELRLQPLLGATDFTPVREFRIGAVLQTWNPATVNGNTVWSISTTGLVTAPLSMQDLQRSFDVTTIVSRWASGAQANNGFGLRLDGEAIPTHLTTGAYGMFNSFASRENSFAPRRPLLVIDFE